MKVSLARRLQGAGRAAMWGSMRGLVGEANFVFLANLSTVQTASHFSAPRGTELGKLSCKSKVG